MTLEIRDSNEIVLPNIDKKQSNITTSHEYSSRFKMYLRKNIRPNIG